MPDRHCGVSGKACFKVRRKAKQFAKKLAKDHGCIMGVYRCRSCGMYHLTTRKKRWPTSKPG